MEIFEPHPSSTTGPNGRPERLAEVDDAIVVDIQRFSLHDGPGLRTTVFLKGCALRCLWCQNPEALRAEPEMAFYAERCCKAGRCAAVCPEKAIVEGSDRRIDFSKCTACGLCAEACDHDAIRLIGARFSAEALAEEILRDRDFFVDSGGGVTFSGGEPMMQAAFLKRLLPRLKKEGIHVAMETAGLFNWAQMTTLLVHIDLVYFDLKHMNSSAHRRLTGAGNELVLENFGRLVRSPVRLEARMPVAPGFNDDADNLRATARFLLGHGHARLHCLAYHNLGEAKLPRIAPILSPLAMPGLDPPELDSIARRFREEGVYVIVAD